MKVLSLSQKELRRLLYTAAPIVALTVLFACDAAANPPANLLSLLAGAALLFLFILLGVRFIPRWMDAWSGNAEIDVHAADGKRSGRRAVLHPVFKIILGLTIYRLVLFALAYLFAYHEGGYQGGVFDTIDLWSPISFDARHYLNIAENWYQSTGPDRYLLVFLPFYPIVVRIFNFIFQNSLVSGLFVSNAACVFAGYVFYELALMDMDVRTARRSLKYLCILPAAFLLSAPLSDSLFLLLSVSTMYYARKKNYPAACIIGFFASFTRLLGVTLLAPVCFEVVADIVRERKAGLVSAEHTSKQIVDVASLVLIPAGLCLYLYINYSVSGSALQFLTYQNANWQQRPGWFFHTAEYQFDYLISALGSGDYKQLLGLWLPNLVFLFSSVALLIGSCNRLRPSYTAYFIAYYAMSMGATWLLSAPRYLSTLFPLALSLALLTRKKAADTLATILCVIGLIGYLYAFIAGWNVY